MKYCNLHPWDVTPKCAIAIQKKLRERIELHDFFNTIEVIAGADVSFDSNDWSYGGVITCGFPGLEEIERHAVRKKITFPYIPGLLAFREAPVLLVAFALLVTELDLVLFDGQGIAPNRRMGIATHMGILLNKPTIGCAKSRLVGKFEEPLQDAGSYTPLVDGKETDHRVAALPTRAMSGGLESLRLCAINSKTSKTPRPDEIGFVRMIRRAVLPDRSPDIPPAGAPFRIKSLCLMRKATSSSISGFNR